MRQVQHHEGRRAADLLGDLLEGVGRDLVVLVQGGGRGEQRQAVAAADHHPVHQHRVQPVGLAQGVEHALQRILVEVEAGGAERQVQVDHHRGGLHALGHRPGEVVGQGRGPDAALGADEGDLPPDERRGGVGIEAGDRADDLQRALGLGDVLADPAPHQFAIEGDVVGLADDHDLGARVADLGQAVQQGQHARRGVHALDQHQRGVDWFW